MSDERHATENTTYLAHASPLSEVNWNIFQNASKGDNISDRSANYTQLFSSWSRGYETQCDEPFDAFSDSVRSSRTVHDGIIGTGATTTTTPTTTATITTTTTAAATTPSITASNVNVGEALSNTDVLDMNASKTKREQHASKSVLGYATIGLAVIVLYLMASSFVYFASLQEDHDRIGIITLLPTDSDVGVYIDELVSIDDTLRRLGMVSDVRDDTVSKAVRLLQQPPTVVASRGDDARASDPSDHGEFENRPSQDDLALYDVNGNQLYSPDLVAGLGHLKQLYLPPADVVTATEVDALKAAKRSSSPTETLSHLLELAPPLTPPMLDLCGPVPQFNPVKGRFFVKSMCWDNIYYNAILKMLSPRAWNATVEEHMRASRSVPLNAQRHANKQRRLVDDVFTQLRDSQKSRLLDMHRDCLCSDQIGFPGAFAVVCDVKPDFVGHAVRHLEPECDIYIYPSLIWPTPDEKTATSTTYSIVSSNVVYAADRVQLDAHGYSAGFASDTTGLLARVDLESSTLARQDAIQREFNNRLSIQDNGHLMHNETIHVSYYTFPTRAAMDFFYSPVVSDAITGYHLMATQRSKHTPYLGDVFSKDPLNAVWDAFRDEYIGQDALGREALKRVTLARENENMNVAAMGRQRLRRMEVLRSRREEGLMEQAARRMGIGRREKNCTEFIDKFVYVQHITDQAYDKSSGMTPACLQTLHSQPRLQQRREKISGHAAHCVMQCVRQTDISRLKKLEYDYRHPVRALFSDEAFNGALNKLRSDEAYAGIAFP